MKILIDKLRGKRSLSADEYLQLISCKDLEVINYLQGQAREVAVSQFGNKVYMRGLIEISNSCWNNCFYCGIRKNNTRVKRYRMSKAEILDCCEKGYNSGIRTFVLQGGEDPHVFDAKTEEIIAAIRNRYPDCAITLSLGEKSREAYERFFNAGANRYLLRHETYNEEHYRRLHPKRMVLENRLRCLNDLKEVGYQTGTGIMVGSPLQTAAHIVEDLQFIEKFQPEMIGIGPFIPHKETPFALFPSGSVRQALILISILRLMFPASLIPATTSLATSTPSGRERGIIAGANVVMPNLTPYKYRKNYDLYDNKVSSGAESVDGIETLRSRMQAIGYDVTGERGDYNPITG